MRNIQHDARRRQAQRVENRIEGLGGEIVDPVECRRCRQQAEVVGAFREQPFHDGGIEPFGREHRIGDALRRILIVVETGGAEREVEIDDDGIHRQIAPDGPGHVMRDSGCTDAALGADDGDDAAERDGLRRREQAANRAHHVQRVNRSDHVVADAAAHQFAIGRGIMGGTDHDDAGSGIAHTCEFVEAGKDVVAAVGFQDDHVRRRHAAIDVDGRHHAAHLDRKMGLGEAAILARRSNGGRSCLGLAIGLYRHARCRGDVIVRERRCVARLLVGIFVDVFDHLPVSLSLAFSASG